MNNKTALYYILSGASYYQTMNREERAVMLRRQVDKEIEYFFEKRYVRREPWHERYFPILIAVFSMNLLARRIERKLFHSYSAYGDKYSKFAPATILALIEYNKHQDQFIVDVEPFVFIKDLVYEVNGKVNSYCCGKGCEVETETFVHSNTPIGIELEFSNKGHSAGNFFATGKDDELENFSKYHYYHLMKFMWRLGAYVDSDTPFKQFIRKGGFLEYTFTKPDVAFKPSEPLTSSPGLASRMVEESVRFTAVRPHSLHITFQLDERSKKLPKVSFIEILFLMMCTGHFVRDEAGVTETRLTEGNMKEWATIRDRRNVGGWVITIEFTHMRVNREFVDRKIYEPSMLLLLAYKNLFNFSDIDIYSIKLVKWAENPYVPEVDVDIMLEKVKAGLDVDVALPEGYKQEAIKQIRGLYNYNKELLIN
ncbi:MAG: hypothetical protein C0603_04630 [Denitrovibrio sp.]|nr:MAG: hypothetical protein C0603_04630 [Denitrovibrio sp.]